MDKKQSGFTLVEIAIVLVIIGLLLGGILKGQELINSARVRNLADMNAGIQAAYFGFIDRYRRVPGDWAAFPAAAAIGVPIFGGGNNNGRLDNPIGGTAYNEANAVWEQLAKAGFIQGSFLGTPGGTPTTLGNLSPLNAFNNVVTIGRTNEYLSAGVPPAAVPSRLHLVLGRGVPVNIELELDTKLDDGIPDTGVLRATVATAAVFTAIADTAGNTTCTAASGLAVPNPQTIWNVTAAWQDCNTVFLY